ncbi:MAG: pantetheine-phosphate adenylyltransferase [Bacillales bacterium]
MKIAIYPGSFDPITNGHLDIIERASKIFDKVIVLVSINNEKHYLNSIEERVSMIEKAIEGINNVEVDSYLGLTASYFKEKNACAIIRGLRVVSDFEYEWQFASANEFIDPNIEIVFFMAHKMTSFISSSTINEMYLNGVDISSLVPKSVINHYNNKKLKN